jgi:hypothetical protein
MPDVFFPGHLVRVKDYLFEDGTTRDKYLLVLLRNEQSLYILHSLTTSQNKFNLSASKIGCYHHPKLSTYFHFPAKEVFGNGNFYFDKETYILFSNNIRKVELADLLALHEGNLDPFTIAHITTLTNTELKQVIGCAINSRFIPMDIKAELTTFRDAL